MFSPQQLLLFFRYFVIGGLVRLFGCLLFSVCKVIGIYHVSNAVSHVFFWMAANIIFEKVELRKKGLAPLISKLFLFYCLNDFIDELVFNPAVFGANEFVFFILTLYWFISRYRKLK